MYKNISFGGIKGLWEQVGSGDNGGNSNTSQPTGGSRLTYKVSAVRSSSLANGSSKSSSSLFSGGYEPPEGVTCSAAADKSDSSDTATG